MTKADMANSSNSSAIYGNPFSYLTTGENEPQRSSFRASDPKPDPQAPEEDKRPFSYLTTSPSDKLASMAATYAPDEHDEVFATNNPDSKRFNFDSLYQPPPANHFVGSSNNLSSRNGVGRTPGSVDGGPHQGVSITDAGRTSGGGGGVYQGMSNHAYVHGEGSGYTELGHLPGVTNSKGEPLLYSGEYDPTQQPDDGTQRPHSADHPSDTMSPQSPTSRVRPATRESAMVSSYRDKNSSGHVKERGDGRGKAPEGIRTCCWVATVVVVTLAALTLGFLAGWFIQLKVMPAFAQDSAVDLSTSAGLVTSTVRATLSSASAATDTTTATATATASTTPSTETTPANSTAQPATATTAPPATTTAASTTTTTSTTMTTKSPPATTSSSSSSSPSSSSQ